MSRIAFHRLAPLVAALAAACGASPVELRDLESALLEARCERAVRCHLHTSVAACRAYFRAPPPNSHAEAIAAGHLGFRGEQARACADALAAASCDLTARDARLTPDACVQMFVGKIADGDACAADEQCGSGRCDHGVCPEGECCIGRCGETRPRGVIGGRCDRTSECGDGYCAMDHTCQPLGADGATCAADEQCGFGLACVTASPSLPGTCKPLGRTGAACVLGRCAELGATCNASNQCVAVGLPGATCAAQADCSVFAECDVPNQRCVELPTLGMACDRACAGESWCNFNGQTIGTCTEPQPNGTPCEESDKCLSQNCKPGTVTESCQDYPICP